MIRYRSTRGAPESLTFEEATLAGLAPDGGLYLPERVPEFAPQEVAEMAALPYPELALRAISPFTEGSIAEDDLRALLHDAYKSFRHPAIAPLVQIGEGEFLLELFHGPTLAFKDFALQFLARLLEHFLNQRGETLTLIGATSGDTGSAAIEAVRGRDSMRLFVLHPEGRVSDVQRRQMTTVTDKNVFNIAVKGTFDDCQAIVKALFADPPFRARHRLAAVNSINWARILAQVVYYFSAALSLGSPGRAVRFSVPTGNFGDIYAGFVARKMGLPIEKLVIATNENDILARTLTTGTYAASGVKHTLSPSMDIQVSSNFERLLSDLYDGDAAEIGRLMRQFETTHEIAIAALPLSRLRALFLAASADDAETKAAIASLYKETGQLLDPHTAVGVAASRKLARDPAVPLVCLATAHPAKFPRAVEEATGLHSALPAHLKTLMTDKERLHALPNNAAAVKELIENA